MTVRVGVVLDHSALLAYARLEGLAVGELLTVLAEDGDVAGIPAACLLTAHAALAGDPAAQGRLAGLAGHPDAAVVVLPLLGADAVDIIATQDKAGELIGRHAVIEAARRQVPLATYQAAAARPEVDSVLDLAAH